MPRQLSRKNLEWENGYNAGYTDSFARGKGPLREQLWIILWREC